MRRESVEKRKGNQIPFLILIPAADLAPGPMRLDLKCHVAGEPGPAANFSWTFEHQTHAPGGR
jgi:hypothetical protein